MQVRFLYPRKIDGKLYAPGAYALPDALAKNWYFAALVKAKDILVDADTKPVSKDLAKSEAALPKAAPASKK